MRRAGRNLQDVQHRARREVSEFEGLLVELLIIEKHVLLRRILVSMIRYAKRRCESGSRAVNITIL
jgi:hypothetical protein